MPEILHQLIWSISHYLHGFAHPRWLAGFLPSTVGSFFGDELEICFFGARFFLGIFYPQIFTPSTEWIFLDQQKHRDLRWISDQHFFETDLKGFFLTHTIK